MNHGRERRTGASLLVVTAALVLFVSADTQAQRGQPQPPQSPRAGAPIDITGTWVSVISEDWVVRMLPPRKGDYPRVPMTPAGRKIADAWDPARDQAAGEQCRAYGAAGIVRLPGRLRVSWQDDTTMKMDFEAGTQTRLLHFRPASPPPTPSWQGHSVAEWQVARNPPRSGELKVVTSRMRPGYLRTNGVPYSANATMTEYFHLMKAPNGDTWLTVVAEVVDPENLREPFVQSSHFKKVPDSTPFRPEPCSAS